MMMIKANDKIASAVQGTGFNQAEVEAKPHVCKTITEHRVTRWAKVQRPKLIETSTVEGEELDMEEARISGIQEFSKTAFLGILAAQTAKWEDLTINQQQQILQQLGQWHLVRNNPDYINILGWFGFSLMSIFFYCYLMWLAGNKIYICNIKYIKDLSLRNGLANSPICSLKLFKTRQAGKQKVFCHWCCFCF